MSWPPSRNTTLSSDPPYRYRERGGVLELEYVCPPHALCAPPPHLGGRVTRDGLQLREAFDPTRLLRYSRLPD